MLMVLAICRHAGAACITGAVAPAITGGSHGGACPVGEDLPDHGEACSKVCGTLPAIR